MSVRGHVETLRRLLCWLAAAYLGYWLTVLIDDALLRLTLYPALGAPLLDWRVTPFRAFLNNGDLASQGLSFWLRALLPLVPGAALLALMLRFGESTKKMGRLLTHFAAFWIVLFFSSQAALLAYIGRTRFGAPLSLLGAWTSTTPARIAAAVLLLILFFWVGIRLVNRLVTHWGPLASARERLAFAFSLALPVLLILLGSLNFRLRFFGWRSVILLGVPALFCLLLGWLATKRAADVAPGFQPGKQEDAALQGRRYTGAASSAPTGYMASDAPGALATAGLVMLAVGLFVVLQQAPRAEAMFAERNLASYSTAHYEIRYDAQRYDAASVRNLAEERERLLTHFATRLRMAGGQMGGGVPDEVRIRLVLYPDFVSKRTATGSDRPYNVEGPTVRAMLHGYLREIDPAADAEAFLHATWGPPGNPLLGEWTAHLLAGEWRGRNIEEAAGEIVSEVGHYHVARLLDTRPESFISPLVRAPLGAAWIRLVYDRYGLVGVRKVYALKLSATDPAALAEQLGISADRLEDEWLEWMQKLAAEHPSTRAARASNPDADFFRGVSFSHEGFGGRRGGYTGPEAEQQLRKLRDLGVNSISVVPYGFMPDVASTTISLDGADETDEELTQALYTARSMGIKVMLKPQLWVSRGIFTGKIHFDDAESRARWMRSYREFILHYARLAELERFDLLCIGNELEGMSSFEGPWRQLIAEVRRVYHGPITYAANWGREFETLAFWDAVDYIGLNNYYPLAQATAGKAAKEPPETTREEIMAGARNVVERVDAVHRRWHKPVLFTEVGYPSVRGAAAQPWIEDRARGIALNEQAASYEAVFAAFADRPWLRGMFWWKWPSSGRGGGPQDPSFSPLDKPAEQVLRAWYTRMANGVSGRGNGTP